jgi:glucose/arabinose dehydrogenase
VRTTWIALLGLLLAGWIVSCRDSTTFEHAGPSYAAMDTVAIAGQELYVPPGFAVNLFATGLSGVRTLALAPDGAVYAARSEDGAIVRLVDPDGDGVADETTTVLSGLNYPFGLAFRGDTLYFAVQTRVRRLDPGQTTPVTIVSGLPTGGHVSRSIAFGPDNRLYLAMGSSCDVCDDAPPRAAVTRYDLDGSNPYTFATGLRNSVGIAFHPATGQLWANNNDRDNLSDDAPPEHLNIVRDGRWYGWPQCYLPGQSNPEYAGAACWGVEPPAITFPAHAAPLGLVFYTGATFPAEYHGDAFMTYHGSWNRSVPVEPRVVRVRVENGRPTAIEDFLTGFQPAGGSRWGRPVSLLVMPDGALLVSDDAGGRIWRVSFGGGGGDPSQTGALDLSAVTTGSQLDDDAYMSVLDGSRETVVGINATVRISDLAAGGHTIFLDGVAENCVVSGANPRTVTITGGAVSSTTFGVTCGGAPTGSTGGLDVTAVTTGSHLDSDAYMPVLDWSREAVVDINETVHISDVAAGAHTIFLDGVAENCTVTAPNPRTVTITAGATTGTTFSVRCL